MRKGLIADLGPASKAVEAALKQAEFTALINIGECVVAQAGRILQDSTPMAESSLAAA